MEVSEVSLDCEVIVNDEKWEMFLKASFHGQEHSSWPFEIIQRNCRFRFR